MLKRKIKKGIFKTMGEISGLEIKPKNSKKAILVKKVTIADKKFMNKYACKQMDKRLKKMYDIIFKFLTDEDDSENGIKICLGEIEKCKSALFNKYKEALQNKKYREYIAKIALTETEFHDKYFEREYFNDVINKMYKEMELAEEEEEKISKSR